MEGFAEPGYRIAQIGSGRLERGRRPIALDSIDPPRIEAQADQACLQEGHVLRRDYVELDTDRRNRALGHLRIGREHSACLPALDILVYRMNGCLDNRSATIPTGAGPGSR
jgi:hypothetical protein